ncbi:hypothetical protein CANARDRAFT_175598 [[Candida] arabinofermentans NRRL YB-2248]|uniref:Dephospho-CoA kinase n=1 Tax=[Candida] arabinofermentans NRRL YB-2248 TaxID=983967 RepID=A0A1E4T237_9ASCO|nr:hypothetical protein CANARDRAFT_175598 [[Candida] arabinofermentans NRRL YB-2248]
MLIVGLTGGIASGKSTGSKRLEENHHLKIIDADKIAREIVEPGKPAYLKIKDYFQPKVPNLFHEDGTLNRPALGSYVFTNKDELKVLNSITHSQVRKEMFWRVIKSWFTFQRMVILDVPLLFEAKLDLFCGTTICVMCDEKTQMKRLMERNPELSKEDCENRIKNQMSNEERIKKADVILDNNTNLEEFYSKLDRTVQNIKPYYLLSLIE